MKKIMIMGNWKMNLLAHDVEVLLNALLKNNLPKGIRAGIAPSYLWLAKAREMLKNSAWNLAAQNVSEHEKGAFTGEVSASMLKSIGCNYCLVGHSERRQFFAETDENVADKIQRLYHEGIVPILCVGETEQERLEGRAEEVVANQLKGALAGLPQGISLFPIAYEPVWAIGTGKHCDPQTASQMMVFIKKEISAMSQSFDLEDCLLLYGGSVKGDNIVSYLSTGQIDGALVGGASLKGPDFWAIIEAAGGYLDE